MQYASSACGDLSLLFPRKRQGTNHFDVHGITVHLTVNCYSLDAQPLRCTYHPTSNFPTSVLVNNVRNGAGGDLVTGWQSRFCRIMVSSHSK